MIRNAIFVILVLTLLVCHSAFVDGKSLTWSTYLGGQDIENGNDIVCHPYGHVSVVGWTASIGFPTTAGVYDGTHNGSDDVFVARFDAATGALQWATFLGGSGRDYGNAITVECGGYATVTGTTSSQDFPTTVDAYDTSHNGGPTYGYDAFVTVLDYWGNGLIYSTYLGGSGEDWGEGIDRPCIGYIYVTGYTNSSNFPTTAGAYDTSHNGGGTDGYDAFATCVSGSSLSYSTYLGGSNGGDWGMDIAMGGTDVAYVVGYTASSDFPTTPGAYDTTHNGGGVYNLDVFVTKLNSSGTSLGYSTFLGGTDDDRGWGIDLGAGDEAFITGGTVSSNFPTTPGAYDTTHNGGVGFGDDVFVTRFNASGSALRYSTFLGGSSDERGFDIEIDSSYDAYVTGFTESSDFPTTDYAHDRIHNGAKDAFVSRVDSSGGTLSYSTFLGGSSDDVGNGIALCGVKEAHVAGTTYSTNFPTTIGAFDRIYNGSGDAFVCKLSPTSSAADLASFCATGYDDYISIEWTTECEIDNAGFNIHRSLGAEGPHTRINDRMIPASGSAADGAAYSFIDDAVTAGITYYYWLEDVDVHGTGILHGPVAVTAGSAGHGGEGGAPAAFALSQNFPNPFNPLTEITYDLPVDCHVRLDVYNVLGERIVTLVDEYQKAGDKAASWNGRDANGAAAPSGIYFYRLYAGDCSAVRKMILLR